MIGYNDKIQKFFTSAKIISRTKNLRYTKIPENVSPEDSITPMLENLRSSIRIGAAQSDLDSLFEEDVPKTWFPLKFVYCIKLIQFPLGGILLPMYVEDIEVYTLSSRIPKRRWELYTTYFNLSSKEDMVYKSVTLAKGVLYYK